MGEMYGSCGHKVTMSDLKISCPIVDYSVDGECLRYGVYCPTCRKSIKLLIKKGKGLEKKLGLKRCLQKK